MFSFQGASFIIHNSQLQIINLSSVKKLNEASNLSDVSVNLLIYNLEFVIRNSRSGGPKWTRTIDLTIISRVL